MANFAAFTLYEVFGYLMPGGVTLLAFLVLYWAVLVPGVPIGIATFQMGIVTWVAVAFASYLLGHATQGVSNLIFSTSIEDAVLNTETGSAPKWMRDCAKQAANEILKITGTVDFGGRWTFRTLDEFAVQTGQAGDRDIFVYREGFYRATSISLLFLCGALIVRLLVPGACIQFTHWLFHISFWELLMTAAVSGGIGYLFVGRYRRFADYRITRAVLAALVLRGMPKENNSHKSGNV
jgi:hypothetical protein